MALQMAVYSRRHARDLDPNVEAYTGTLCGAYPATLGADPTHVYRKVSCRRCLSRLAKLAAAMDALGRALEVK